MKRFNIIKKDTCFGIVKSIFINNIEYNDKHEIIININDNNVYSSITNPYGLVIEGDLNDELQEHIILY